MAFFIKTYLCGFGLLCSLLILSPVCRGQQQHLDPDPFAAIRQITRPAALTGAGYVYADAEKLAALLVRPVGLDADTASSVASYLASQQIDWQSGSQHGIEETKLVQSLNTMLQLTNAPEYLKLHQDELNRIRVLLWSKLPDLNGGFGKRPLAKGQSVITASMSPFEAYASAGLLLLQKLHNDKFLRTPAEASAARARPEAPLSPGLHFAAVSSRQIEFRQHLQQLIKDGALSSGSLLQSIQSIIEESRQ